MGISATTMAVRPPFGKPASAPVELRFEGLFGNKAEKAKKKFPGRTAFATASAASLMSTEAAAALLSGDARFAYIGLLPIIAMGAYDGWIQKKHTIRRNFPFLGRFRYLIEDKFRDELRQYFVEGEIDGVPFDRRTREQVYQMAKGESDKSGFGTLRKPDEEGATAILHRHFGTVDAKDIEEPRISIGNKACKQPYDSSVFNISAMSYGSLGAEAVESLNRGAAKDNFAHNTGEGGISEFHEKGGDLIYQIGTGYFGCRNADGTFSPEKFREQATKDHVKMIEVKLSQGAKPSLGGILPAAKNTLQIARARGVEPKTEVHSPERHSAFKTPREFLGFISLLKDLSGGKPVGFKLCVGEPHEFMAICKAMAEAKDKGEYDKLPDFITVDGAEGGTGSAPPEYTDHVGMPLEMGLNFVHNTLAGFNLRDDIRVLASGKVVNAFDLYEKLAMGADAAYSARGFMFSLGCIQALACHNNTCPSGVATQDPSLRRGLFVEDKMQRVANYHHAVIERLKHLMATTGVTRTEEITPKHIRRVKQGKLVGLDKILEFIKPGSLLKAKKVPGTYKEAWHAASADTFERIETSGKERAA